MFGGYNMFGIGTILTRVDTLPPHFLVRVSFNMFKINSWNGYDFVVYLDGDIGYRRTFEAGSGS